MSPFFGRGSSIGFAAFAFAVFAGCGGGSSPSPSSAPTRAVIAYTVDNSSPTPLVGVQFSAYLPAGVDLPLVPGTHQVAPENLAAGSALSGLNVLVFGTYSAPIRKLKLGVSTGDARGFNGEVLKLTCNLPQTQILGEASFSAANNAVPVDELFGYRYDATTMQSIPLNASLQSSLVVTLN